MTPWILDTEDGTTLFIGCGDIRPEPDQIIWASKQPLTVSQDIVAARIPGLLAAWECEHRRALAADRLRTRRANGMKQPNHRCPVIRAKRSASAKAAWTPERRLAASIAIKARLAALRLEKASVAQ